MWRALFQILTIFMVFKMYVACSEVQFNKVRSSDAVTNCDQRSDCQPSTKNTVRISNAFTVKGQADILFVVDNSGSMSIEHGRMDSSFPGLFSKISNLDYRIALTTTDISGANNPPRAINNFGALQDGKLIQLSDGRYFIDTLTPDAETLFTSAIKRQETLDCEAHLKKFGNSGSDTACPSFDERGIYAANLVIANNPESFIRDSGHLAIIVISDEDERSNESVRAISQFSLKALDQPDVLVSSFASKFAGSATKSLAVHSIIIKPGDTSCLTEQSSQPSGVNGYEGDLYAQASELTGGVIGSVCESDYTTEMGEIGNDIAASVSGFQLECDSEDLLVDFTPAVEGVQVVQEGRNVSFSGPLLMNSTVTYSYTCPSY